MMHGNTFSIPRRSELWCPRSRRSTVASRPGSPVAPPCGSPAPSPRGNRPRGRRPRSRGDASSSSPRGTALALWCGSIPAWRGPGSSCRGSPQRRPHWVGIVLGSRSLERRTNRTWAPPWVRNYSSRFFRILSTEPRCWQNWNMEVIFFWGGAAVTLPDSASCSCLRLAALTEIAYADFFQWLRNSTTMRSFLKLLVSLTGRTFVGVSW